MEWRDIRLVKVGTFVTYHGIACEVVAIHNYDLGPFYDLTNVSPVATPEGISLKDVACEDEALTLSPYRSAWR